ncbi:hypothetical protein BGZ54_005160 [Gamsiella multidivaricata]|nr:hypothetical protein BGZ54_005160 [Gamsiella multidivaricata]
MLKPPTSESPAPSISNISKGKRPHIYTHEQETSIAELLTISKYWRLLSGPSSKTPKNENKTKILVELKEINIKFTLELDDKQLKNKIMNMELCWKKANDEFRRTENGDLPASTLKQRVLKLCHYYDIIYRDASRSIKLNPPEVCQLITNLSYKKAACDASDGGESGSNDEDEARPQEFKARSQDPKRSKGRGRDGVDMVELIDTLVSKSDQQREWKRSMVEEQERRAAEQLKLDKRVAYADEFQKRTLDMQQQIVDIDMRIKHIQEQTMMAGLVKAQAEAQKAVKDAKRAAKERRKAAAEATIMEVEAEMKKADMENRKRKMKAEEGARRVERETLSQHFEIKIVTTREKSTTR